jgi:ATP-dependent Clp protease ATP-binding subunit ClpA
MFERFTDRSRRVVVLAQEEARQMNHNYMGTEHLLLGLLAEAVEKGSPSIASAALASFGLTLEDVRKKVEAKIGTGQHPPSGHIPFTPRHKKVQELSLREALQLNHSYIGTEHLLLALIREGEGVGGDVLRDYVRDFSKVRSKVLELLGSELAHQPEHEVGSWLFSLFNDNARRVIVLTEEEARKLNHNYLGTEHLLLGLLRTDAMIGNSTIASLVLEAHGLTYEEALKKVEVLVDRGEKPVSGHIPFTPRLKRVVERSLRESQRINDGYIGPEHLLLALTTDSEGAGSIVLKECAPDFRSIRTAVYAYITSQPVYEVEGESGTETEEGFVDVKIETFSTSVISAPITPKRARLLIPLIEDFLDDLRKIAGEEDEESKSEGEGGQSEVAS